MDIKKNGHSDAPLGDKEKSPERLRSACDGLRILASEIGGGWRV